MQSRIFHATVYSLTVILLIISQMLSIPYVKRIIICQSQSAFINKSGECQCLKSGWRFSSATNDCEKVVKPEKPKEKPKDDDESTDAPKKEGMNWKTIIVISACALILVFAVVLLILLWSINSKLGHKTTMIDCKEEQIHAMKFNNLNDKENYQFLG
ncbi:MAG: hypothetical protein MHMPM18_001927 [Marteilia pararefringens]